MLTLRYDREADILYVDTCPPHADQVSEELDDEVIARCNAATGEVETLEILWFSSRLLRHDLMEFPISVDLRRAG